MLTTIIVHVVKLEKIVLDLRAAGTATAISEDRSVTKFMIPRECRCIISCGLLRCADTWRALGVVLRLNLGATFGMGTVPGECPGTVADRIVLHEQFLSNGRELFLTLLPYHNLELLSN